MKRRFSEEQIIGILREQEAGGAVKEITRRHGISEQSFYRWMASPAIDAQAQGSVIALMVMAVAAARGSTRSR